jgi:riboflavin synthase alpha subunit
MGQERGHFVGAEVLGVTQVVEVHEAANPVEVRFLRAGAVVVRAQLGDQAIPQAR